MFQFPSNGKVYSEFPSHIVSEPIEKFQFPSNGKVYSEGGTVEIKTDKGLGFNSLQTGKCIQRKHSSAESRTVSGFNSLQTGKCIQRDPILSPVGPGLRTPKTKRELREAFFTSKFTPKTPQTHVCIDPNAIFQQNRLRSETPSGFLGNLSRTRTRLVNRVWVYLLSIPQIRT